VKDRVALVTGAGSPEGIGFACARALAAGGARVALTSTTARINDRLASLGSGHRAYMADLTDAKATGDLIANVVKDFGRLDIIINNAGMVQTGKRVRSSRIQQMPDSEWHHHLAVNVTTAFHVIRAALPAMRRRNYGRIVNICSVTGPLVINPHSG